MSSTFYWHQRIAVVFVSATYCSRECQVDDWKQGGHKHDCKNMITSGLLVEQRGGTRKEAKTENVFEENIRVIGSQIFHSHIRSILTQALLQKYDILDCVTVINLCQAPPTVNVKLRSVVFSVLFPGSMANHDSCEATKRIVEQNRQTGVWTVVIMAFRSAGPDDVMWVMKSFLDPSDPEMRRTVDNAVKSMQHCPDELETHLRDLRLAKAAYIDTDDIT